MNPDGNVLPVPTVPQMCFPKMPASRLNINPQLKDLDWEFAENSFRRWVSWAVICVRTRYMWSTSGDVQMVHREAEHLLLWNECNHICIQDGYSTPTWSPHPSPVDEQCRSTVWWWWPWNTKTTVHDANPKFNKCECGSDSGSPRPFRFGLVGVERVRQLRNGFSSTSRISLSIQLTIDIEFGSKSHR